MTDEKSSSLDILGVKPLADSISKTTTATLDAASAFLSRICLPAAEEFGLLLQDKVRVWRSNNALKVVSIAQRRLQNANDKLHAHPRLVSSVLEHGSWSDEKELQEMWGGLLASSCTKDAKDDSNVIFVHLLSHLTSLQARILTYSCENCVKNTDQYGLIGANDPMYIDIDLLKSIAMSDDIHRIDRELDNLRGLELIHSGIEFKGGRAEISPTALALHLYIRSNGSIASPKEYFGIQTEAQPA